MIERVIGNSVLRATIHIEFSLYHCSMEKKVDIAAFDFNALDQALEWVTWSKRFKLGLTLASKKKWNAEKRAAALRLWGGADLDALIDRLLEKEKSAQSSAVVVPYAPREGNDGVETRDVFEKAMELLEQHFDSKRNVTYPKTLFRLLRQESNETIGAFGARIRKHATLCQADDQEMILQVFSGATSLAVRKKAAKAKDFEKLISAGEMEETIDKQVKESKQLEPKPEETVSYVRRGEARQSSGVGSRRFERKFQPYESGECTNCGGKHAAGSDRCYARNKECRSCKSMGHLAAYCRKSGGRFAAKIGAREQRSEAKEENAQQATSRRQGVNQINDDEMYEKFLPGPPSHEQV